MGTVEKDIQWRCKKIGLVDHLPKLPSTVGGDTDILIGIKYFKIIYEFESGLGIYESVFQSPCGSRGIVGRPHKEFSKIENKFKGMHVENSMYGCFQGPIYEYRAFWKLCNGMPLLGVKENFNMFDMDTQSYSNLNGVMKGVKTMGSVRCKLEDGSDNMFNTDAKVCVARKQPKCVRQFNEIESAGTEVTYRCMHCRGCLKCKNGPRFDAMSIQEEMSRA